MERSAIRDRSNSDTVPGFRFAPSGLPATSLRSAGIVDVARWFRVAWSERALRENDVGPASILETDRLEHASALEPERFVQVLRGRVGDIDIGDHLAIAGGGAGIDQGGQEASADAGMQVIGVHIDRMLDRIAVGRAF